MVEGNHTEGSVRAVKVGSKKNLETFGNKKRTTSETMHFLAVI